MKAWLNQINADRAANGTPNKLQIDDILTIAAFDHAADMSKNHYFSGNDPAPPAGDGLTPWARWTLLGLESPSNAAENIGSGFSNWQAAESAFMATKANSGNCKTYTLYCDIVNPNATHIGLAIAQAPGRSLDYEQDFSGQFTTSDTVKTGAIPPVTGSPLPPEYFDSTLNKT
jgi:uncharacterized protein YkwD